MIDAFLTSDWFTAAMRLLFAGGVYLFLFLVLRSTARSVTLIARGDVSPGDEPGSAGLVVIDGADSSVAPGTIFRLMADSVIGRDAGVAVSIDDPRISARHAELSFRHNQWWLRDLGSSNGTTLNGQTVHSVVAVRSGDVLQCAAVRLKFVEPWVASAERQVA